MPLKKVRIEKTTRPYKHSETMSMRPDVGTQTQFRKKRGPKTYLYDSSLAPSMNWDEGSARGYGEWLIQCIEDAAREENLAFDSPREFKRGCDIIRVYGLRDAVQLLKGISKPFLEWTGKAERLSFDVPTLPLFVHERLSTKAIIETLKVHRKDKGVVQGNLMDFFNEPDLSAVDKVLKSYEYQDQWVNRMILGDSLVVMNSLLEYESMGGKVQMIYMDPPYGVKFGSNFQPFVKSNDVKDNSDDDMTREPEMVKAYRDTWELGLHSYLTYMRDRLLLTQELLTESGSVFVQISDENIHHVRQLLDEVFGAENFVSQISFQTTSGFETNTIATLGDFLLWYAKDKQKVKVNKLFLPQAATIGEGNARWVLLEDGTYRGVTAAEIRGEQALSGGSKLYSPGDLQSQGASKNPQPFEYDGKTYYPNANAHWKANYPEGMERLAQAGRIHVAKSSLRFRRFHSDFPFKEIGNIWTDTITGSFTEKKKYVVQTNTKVIQRCLLLTTDPGDLVFDPTCGSGTTALVSELWGRRWITADVSRVPLALAKQRLLTSTFPWFELRDNASGPSGGFVYERKQNAKGEEIGGIVPHITLKSIANNEPPSEKVLVDKPNEENGITRVCGPFCFEASIPTPVDWEGDGEEDSCPAIAESHTSFVERMLEVLRKSPVLHLRGGKTVTLEQVRQPAKALNLSAEGLAKNGGDERKPVALVFGPENGAVSEKLVAEAARESYQKSYHHLYVIGFAIEPKAREFIEHCEVVSSIPATYVQATPDILMGDLLKNMRSSQIFSVCGLPDVEVYDRGKGKFQVELLGLDTFDPATMESDHRKGNDVPAWFLDTNYNDSCFHVCQAFFPRTNAWDSLKKALKADYDASVWKHLAGTKSIPFDAPETGKIAVKVIDDRGNELLVVKEVEGAA
ncbi:site-specific DNA-methyltransferase [Oleidesulfovibrio alaskensis]|uniref:site-specific DNA-methyltransferase n=1 Tax=Oleidesulfovibrio alaskensis TaxID=58180 RepID=UPI000489EE48|nr:DNA methyltransferase [Oleidesulfovibrio alaskensis]